MRAERAVGPSRLHWSWWPRGGQGPRWAAGPSKGPACQAGGQASLPRKTSTVGAQTTVLSRRNGSRPAAGGELSEYRSQRRQATDSIEYRRPDALAPSKWLVGFAFIRP